MSMRSAPVLQEIFWHGAGVGLWIKRALLVAAGILVLAVAAKAQVAMWPSPVPITLGTLAVLSIGAAYGPRLGLATILGYLLIGALGFDVFAGSSAERNGLSYMLGGTGGYLAGYVAATLVLGWAARRGWDRDVRTMALAMLGGSVLIYALGVPWLYGVIQSGGLYDASVYASAWSQTLAWGLTPYLIGDALKLGLAALVFPLIWKAVGRARL